MGDLSRLAKKQQRALGRLKSLRTLERFYLAGGTAIALHLGHRRSLALDLFSNDDKVDLEAIRRELTKRLPDARVVAVSDVTLTVLLEGTEVDIVRYPYPPLEPPDAAPSQFPVARLHDLGAMKLSAIAQKVGADQSLLPSEGAGTPRHGVSQRQLTTLVGAAGLVLRALDLAVGLLQSSLPSDT